MKSKPSLKNQATKQLAKRLSVPSFLIPNRRPQSQVPDAPHSPAVSQLWLSVCWAWSACYVFITKLLVLLGWTSRSSHVSFAYGSLMCWIHWKGGGHVPCVVQVAIKVLLRPLSHQNSSLFFHVSSTFSCFLSCQCEDWPSIRRTSSCNLGAKSSK